MRVITIAAAKGGSGKTTLAANLAATAAWLDSAAVLALDPDVRQQSLARWGARRSLDWPVVEACAPMDVARRISRARAQTFDLVVLDTVGFDDPQTDEAIRQADLVVIPSRPTVIDRDGVTPTVRTAQRLGRPFCILLSSVRANTQARATVARESHRPAGCVLDAQLSDRVAYQDAMAAGLSVIELAGARGPANEIVQTWKRIRQRAEAAAGRGR